MPNKDVELSFMKNFTDKHLDDILDALKSCPHYSNQPSDFQYHYRRDSYSPHDFYFPSKSPHSPDPYPSSYRINSPSSWRPDSLVMATDFMSEATTIIKVNKGILGRAY